MCLSCKEVIHNDANKRSVCRFDKNNQYHCETGPAYKDNTGFTSWHIHGKRHRLDGPAIISRNLEDGMYFINGKEYSKEKFDEMTKKFKVEDREQALKILNI